MHQALLADNAAMQEAWQAEEASMAAQLAAAEEDAAFVKHGLEQARAEKDVRTSCAYLSE